MSQGSSGTNGTKPPYLHIADVLRTEILDGRYEVGQQIPTQDALAELHGVSRPTIQRALHKLRDDGYIGSRRGRAAEVLDRRPGAGESASIIETDGEEPNLRAHIAAAFECPHVSIDVFSLTTQTLYEALTGPVSRIKEGTLSPESIRVRLLLPSPDVRLAVPIAVADPTDARPLRRLRGLASAHATALRSTFVDLAERRVVPELSVILRSVRITPMEKLYVINNTTVLRGYYKVLNRRVSYHDEDIEIYDVKGTDAVLFPFQYDEREPGSRDSRYVQESRSWFDSLWSTIAEELTLIE
ncbi:winged helix-turn-helix transcriptional regulator [Streptomyces sp. SID13666]|uniref:GntR family transcriptional regulator n=1 Tax=unclassified Streptomyces TaxID=2593676 RepID=UPI0013C11B65|nr:winged helix-turn-helix transcriptional regulator [Streptomyces sp. SID13666]NEA73118.1 winged helix-turn-helix transcriptional regulator [Streptomyces sp. SID13588]